MVCSLVLDGVSKRQPGQDTNSFPLVLLIRRLELQRCNCAFLYLFQQLQLLLLDLVRFHVEDFKDELLIRPLSGLLQNDLLDDRDSVLNLGDVLLF